MVSTLQAVGLLLVVVIPGAVGTFGYERHVGPVARDATDRLVRYIFGTALLSPFSLLVVWFVWTRLLHVSVGPPRQTFENRLVTGESLSPAWALMPIPYLLVPWTVGVTLGRIRNRYYQWIAGRTRSPAPSDTADDVRSRVQRRYASWLDKRRSSMPTSMTSWDELFLDRGPKLVSLRMRDGHWVAGLYGPDSFASPLASREKEIVLQERLAVDADGRVSLEDGAPASAGGRIRVCAADVDLIVIEDAWEFR